MPDFDGRNWSYEIAQPAGGGLINSRGRSLTKFNAYLEGGPELAAALQRLLEATGEKPAVEAVTAMTDTVSEAWKAKVELGPGRLHYRDAIQSKVRQGVRGAGGTVAVRALAAAELDGEDQPLAYVSAIEFGKGRTPSRPWARSAFESSAGKAVERLRAVLLKAVRGV